MKFNMETMYVPASTIHQKRAMMTDWRTTSDRAGLFSYISAVVSVAMSLYLLANGDDNFYIYIPCIFVFLIGGYLCKKWKYMGYIAVLIAVLCSASRFAFPMPESFLVNGSIIAVCLFNFIAGFFALRCMSNFYTVFKELEKCPGFPDFIANTADLYADKIYLKDVDENIYDNKFEASYNPFNSAEDIKNEEIRRNLDLKSDGIEEKITMDITGEKTAGTPQNEFPKKQPQEIQSKTIFGRYIIFPHTDFSTSSFEEKKDFMGYWNYNIEFTTSNFVLFAFFLMIAGMAAGFGSPITLAYFAIVLVFVFGTNYLKMGKFIGVPIIVIGMLCTSVFFSSAISAIFTVAAYIVNPGMILGTIRFVLNYKYYKELSTMDGFPSFIRTTADLYGDKIYIVEKKEVVKRVDPSQRVIQVMDIGYEKEEKKEDKAWNAFDYMDEQKENENNEG